MTVDLVIFAGQSNMSGAGGKASAAPAVPHNCGFEFRNGQYPPGLYEVAEPFGQYETGYLADPPGLKNGSLVSAFMNTYYGATGVPVLGISMSRGGTDMTYWNSPNVQSEMVRKYDAAKAWCATNHVTVRKEYVVWLQGETDAYNRITAADYQARLGSVFTPLFAKGLKQVFVITIGKVFEDPTVYDQVILGQKNLCAASPYFTLGSDALTTVPQTYLSDAVHYGQAALNLVGSQCASVAASYSKYN